MVTTTRGAVRMTLSRWQIATLLFAAGTEAATLALPGGDRGIVQSVLRESGCGTSFIVRVLLVSSGNPLDVLVRTDGDR